MPPLPHKVKSKQFLRGTMGQHSLSRMPQYTAYGRIFTLALFPKYWGQLGCLNTRSPDCYYLDTDKG